MEADSEGATDMRALLAVLGIMLAFTGSTYGQQAQLGAQYGVQQWPRGAELRANPFALKGQTVGLGVFFNRAVSEKRTVFNTEGVRMIVSGMPPIQFKPGEWLILMGKVTGVETVGVGTAAEEMVALDLVAIKKCFVEGNPANQCPGM